MRRLFAIPAIASLLLLLGTIGAGAATSAARIVSCAGTTWCFSPNPIVVTAGSAVTWTNSTGVTHTATSDTGAWTTGNIGAGATGGPVTFNTPGSFAYHCAIHPFMTGSVVVNAATAPSAAPSASAAPAVVKRLAQGGGGPALLLAVTLLLVGAALLRPASVRRRPRGR
jgi:plastocyanin